MEAPALQSSRLAPLRRHAGLCLAASLLVLVCAWVGWAARAPGSPILLPGARGSWILADEPFDLNGRIFGLQRVAFSTRFTVPPGAQGEPIRVEAREGYVALIDLRPFHEVPPKPGTRSGTMRLPLDLPAGPHELVFVVDALRTCPLLRVDGPAFGLATDATWTANTGAGAWRPARLASEARTPALAYAFPTALQGLARVLPWLGLAFVLAAGCLLLADRKGWPLPRARSVRWALLAAWAVLAANNLTKIPAIVGRDTAGHLDYVKYLFHFHRLPLPSEGWQMFQPPLAYLASVPVYLLRPDLSDASALVALRFIPLLCGLLQVEVCYRAVQAVFPGRNGLQIAGALLGGFLPMNIYIAQAFGNEPLAGLLSSLAILWTLRRWAASRWLLAPGFALGLGGLLGLALLTKVTTLLVVPVLAAFCLLAQASSRKPRVVEGMRFLALLAGAMLLVSGWYYAWVWAHLGRPLVGGWATAQDGGYWQAPGFISLSSLATFGTALVRPVYAATTGFWNALYSTMWLDGCIGSCILLPFAPPWNYSFLAASALTALPPCLALAAGIGAWRKAPVALSLACIGILTLAIFRLHVTEVPSYASVKATYMVGLLPCFAILGASGLDRLPRGPWPRALAGGLLAAWAVSAYASYFVL